MAFNNKPSFAVSVTPKGALEEVDATNVAMTVMHENIRKTLGGSGEITGSGSTIGAGTGGNWANGVNTPISSNGGLIAAGTFTELVLIKHTGVLVAGGSCAAADTVNIAIDASATTNVSSDTVILANLAKGEAMVFPRPGSAWGLVLASVAADVDVEVTTIGT